MLQERLCCKKEEGIVWARLSEIFIGIALLLSRQLFSATDWIGVLSGAITILFALLSYRESLNKMHLLQVLPIGLLFYTGYTYPTFQLPLFLQLYILIALLLLMFAIIPSHASEPPRPWKKFLKNFIP